MAALPGSVVTFLLTDVGGSTELVKRLHQMYGTGTAGVGWAGPATMRCAELCDAAEAGQIFLSQATASLLDDDSHEFTILDVGEQTMRRTGRPIRAFELRRATPADSRS